MLQCRRNEKDFLLRKDKQYVASFNKAVNEVDLQIDRVARLVRRAGNAELAAKLQNCRGDAGKYRDIFHAVAAGWEKMGLDCNSGLQGEFRNAVHQLESLADTAELRMLVLMVRRHEKDFLLRGDEKYVKATHDALAALGKAIANRKLPEPRAKIAGQLVQAYGQSFDGLVAADRSIASVTETMRQTVHQLEPVIEASAAWAKGAAEARREAVQGEALRAANRAMYVAIGAVLAGIAMAVAIAYSITGPLAKATSFAQAIAGGNFDGAIAVDRKDEVGRLAASLRQMADNLRRMLQDVRDAAQREKAAQAEKAEAERRAGRPGTPAPGGGDGQAARGGRRRAPPPGGRGRQGTCPRRGRPQQSRRAAAQSSIASCTSFIQRPRAISTATVEVAGDEPIDELAAGIRTMLQGLRTSSATWPKTRANRPKGPGPSRKAPRPSPRRQRNKAPAPSK